MSQKARGLQEDEGLPNALEISLLLSWRGSYTGNRTHHAALVFRPNHLGIKKGI
jgi:hypothetical protein